VVGVLSQPLLCVAFFCFLQLCLSAAEVERYNDLQEVLRDIREHRNSHSTPPTMADVFSYYGSLDKKIIESATFDAIFEAVLLQQKPDVTLSDIIKIVRAKRDSLRDYIVRYEVTTNSRAGDTNLPEPMLYKFASKKDRFLFEMPGVGSGQSRDIFSYDGNNLILVREFGDIPTQGSVTPAEFLAPFFQQRMPLVVSGLFDSNACGSPDRYYDLVLFLEGDLVNLPDGTKLNFPPHVFEKIEVIGGHRCIAVSNYRTTKYFDIERDFSLISSEYFTHTISDLPQGRMFAGRALYSRTKLYDLKDYGNGMWLPSRVEIEIFEDNGKMKQLDKIFVKSFEINKGIDDAFFTSYIPDDTIMSDVERGLVYRWGDHASINSLLKETAKSKRVWTFQIISMTAGIVMILIALIRMYLRRRSAA